MQKLVTIYLANKFSLYATENHGKVEEHLGEYLTSGWKVLSVTTVDAGGGGYGGWVVVLLEKS